MSCQALRGSGRWLLSLLKELGQAGKEAHGGLKAAILERSAEKARKVCEPVRMTLRMTKTIPITEEGSGMEVYRLADETDKRGSQDDDKPGGARVSGFRRREWGYILQTQSWGKDVNRTTISKHGSNLDIWSK